MEFSLSDMEALAKLLAPVHTEAKEEDACPFSEMTKPSPASIGPHDMLDVQVAAPRAHGRSAAKPASKAPWPAEGAGGEPDDGRELPEYEFRYKQSVTTADNFLGMSGKDPSSTCCEHLVVVVRLPKAETAAELQLDTAPNWLRLASPIYKLVLALPHRVDEERGTAKWDGAKKTLSITLPIIREDAFAT